MSFPFSKLIVWDCNAVASALQVKKINICNKINSPRPPATFPLSAILCRNHSQFISISFSSCRSCPSLPIIFTFLFQSGCSHFHSKTNHLLFIFKTCLLQGKSISRYFVFPQPHYFQENHTFYIPKSIFSKKIYSGDFFQNFKSTEILLNCW